MATVTRTTVWADGNTLTAAALNGEFNNLLNALGLVNADIAGGAGIAYSKLSLTGSVVNTDISNSAAIAVSKIATGLSGSLVGTTDTQTMSGKRITKRVETVSDAASITPSWDSNDVTKQVNSQGSGTLTINAPSGTPNDMDMHEIAIKSSNSQTYSFNTTYKAGNVPLPSSHGGSSKWDIMLFQYNSTDSNWKLVAILQAIS